MQADTTIEGFLRGQVSATIPDEAINSILLRTGVEPGADYSLLSQRQKDLCMAWLYAYLADPVTSETVKDGDADWSHSETRTRASYAYLYYARLANATFKKYGLDLLPTTGSWGMRGGGFHNVHKTNPDMY